MNWDEYYIGMLRSVAAKSKDKETKVGAIIVHPDNFVVSMGFNSLVRGLDDTKLERLERPAKYIWIEHADRNAIYNAARHGIATKGCRMYLPFYPCVDCARGIVSAGITEVIIPMKGLQKRFQSLATKEIQIQNSKNCLIVETMFWECGVNIKLVDIDFE